MKTLFGSEIVFQIFKILFMVFINFFELNCIEMWSNFLYIYIHINDWGAWYEALTSFIQFVVHLCMFDWTSVVISVIPRWLINQSLYQQLSLLNYKSYTLNLYRSKTTDTHTKQNRNGINRQASKLARLVVTRQMVSGQSNHSNTVCIKSDCL